MKVVKNYLVTLKNRIAKRFRRRTRRKGTLKLISQRAGRNYYTEAQRLIDDNYGISYKKYISPGHGRARAEKRLIAHRAQWSKTPVRNVISRQVKRRAIARMKKAG